MSTERYASPDAETVARVIDEALHAGALVTAEVRCEVEYDGRTSGYLGPGDRLLVAKPDGTVLVHKPANHKPVNWMPAGGTVTASVGDASGEPVVVARRTNPRERVEVRVRETYGLTRFDADDTAEYEESGTEAEMHDYIAANPEEVEEGLRIVEHERETKYGYLDFYASDAEGTPVVIEVKRVQATLTHFDQLKRYMDLFAGDEDDVDGTERAVRGMLVAPSASARVKRACRDAGLEFVALPDFETEAAGTNASLADFE
ncbi:RecB family endonuclease NucS [Halarchaeum rubridurum]|uniref:Endonuclease NucS n=1 Tax=Halarchaeum rubridurum TaxID=489911 RepID=A0A830FXR4_9EURY|nr:endonuclease NucS [Halarchaeum rubridurum]MBP1954063.1 RecB family endonuclease NucS [Halarchaeum rubridurum]GGM57039.1 endonuclease NucS [Halarchaeum rubridurum]